jgi:GT2 family glycosyltransferase
VRERPHVAVVVLSWNGRDDTERCLHSLARVTYEPLTLVVVDNGSSDGSAEMVRSEFPETVLVENGANLGFAGGMNAGIHRALELGADAVVLLNNDTEVDPAFAEALVAAAQARPDAGALSAKIYFRDRPDHIWYAGARFDPRRGYNGRHVGYGEQDSARFAQVAETERACGAAMLVTREALDHVGLLDEDLFAYVEDAEWSLRARRAGYRVLVVPESRVWHGVSSTTGGEGSPRALYYSVRNLLVVCERYAPLSPLGTWRRRAVIVGAHAAQALLLRHRRAQGLRAVVQGWRDFRRGRLGEYRR